MEREITNACSQSLQWIIFIPIHCRLAQSSCVKAQRLAVTPRFVALEVPSKRGTCRIRQKWMRRPGWVGHGQMSDERDMLPPCCLTFLHHLHPLCILYISLRSNDMQWHSAPFQVHSGDEDRLRARSEMIGAHVRKGLWVVGFVEGTGLLSHVWMWCRIVLLLFVIESY